jgi:hypothetical protein
MFTHVALGALFYEVPPEREIDWSTFVTTPRVKGETAVPIVLYSASVCLLDVIGIAGRFIVGYEPKWFDDTALPLIGKLSE